MADERITNLTELTERPNDNDFALIVDVSDTTHSLQGTTKKVKQKYISPKVITVYANYAALAADQANQNTHSLYLVTNGAAWTTYLNGWIVVRYLGTTLGTIADYQQQYYEYTNAALLGGQVGSYYLNNDNHTAPTNAKTTPIDADFVTNWDSAASNAPKKTTWTNIKAFLKTYFDTLYLTSSSNVDEEKVIGTAVYNATLTGATNIDLNSFSDYYGILTGNTTITFTNTPASGKTVSKTMYIKSTTTQTLTFADMDYDIGSYLATGVLNAITVNVSNFPTVGLIVRITYEEA